MFDVVALGELLMDFTPKGLSQNGNYIFEANPGGAPCNLLVALSKLGKQTSFIGKVGSDSMGLFLKSTLETNEVDTKGLVVTNENFTTLAFVTLDEQGNRSFSFARDNSADVMLKDDEINEETIKNSKIFHCGTLSLTHPNSKKATIKALDIAKENNILISVDPNLRLSLWKDENQAKEEIDFILRYANIIKISDYELEFLFDCGDIKEGAKKIFEKYNPEILFITCGQDGAFIITDKCYLHHPCYPVNTIDTTGAGDCFCGAALSKILDYNLKFDDFTQEICLDILRYASAAASLSTTKLGGIPSMPSNEEILNLNSLLR